MGNLGSIANMLKKIGQSAQISSDPEVIQNAERLILPGVGAFDNGVRRLDELCLVDVIKAKVKDGSPLLGICLGMQLLSNSSEEGELSGLGLIDAETVKFNFGDDKKLNIPHMGWNSVTVCQNNPVFENLEEENKFYFVHSYHVVCRKEENILTQTEYGIGFASSICNNNILGVQFHPEKSHKYGMQLLKNFTSMGLRS